MKIGGLTPLSLSDYPGQIAAVVFTQGCNFQCPFCHNGSLLPPEPKVCQLMPEKQIFDFLERRRRYLNAVVVSGGEPTIHPDLPELLERIKELGYLAKVDTNGSRPSMIRTLLQWRLVDYIAMDIKAPFDMYDLLSGTQSPLSQIRQSIELIVQSGIDHEFRTTVVNSLLSDEDVCAIQKSFPSGSRYRLQEFQPEHALNPVLAPAVLGHLKTDHE